MLKHCIKCKADLPLNHFFKNRRNKDGLGSWCKICCRNYQRIYEKSEHGKGVQRKAYKKYYKSNRTKRLAYMKKYNDTLIGKLRICWRRINHRCNNITDMFYKNYGAKGIKVEFENFEQFFRHVTIDMGLNAIKQIKGKQIHRIANGNYSPNCIEFLSLSKHRKIHAEMRNGQGYKSTKK